MALRETDAIANAKALRIFAGERERVRGEIDRLQFGHRKASGERESDDAAAGTDIEHARCFRPGELGQIFNQLLGFRARDERAFVGKENVIGEFDRSKKVLERFALAAPPNEFAQWREL